MRILYIGNALAMHGSTPTSADVNPDLLRSEGYDVVVRSNKKSIIFRMFDMLWAIIINSRNLDYVLIDTYSTRNFWYSFFCALLCRLLKIRYIPILHGGNLPYRMTHSPKMTKAIMAHSFCNITPSRYLLETLENHGFSGNLIPNTIRINDYQLKMRHGLRPRLLYVRAFSEIYNPQMALYVLKILLAHYPDSNLCMVGPDRDGTLEKCKLLAKELDIEGHVLFPGKLSKNEWHKLSCEYDIFINTSNHDNMPLSLIEAMALGLPVISTNPGGIPYMLDDKISGLLVNVGDVESMTNKVIFLLKNPEESLLISQRARSNVEHLDWSIVRNLWKNLLEQP